MPPKLYFLLKDKHNQTQRARALLENTTIAQLRQVLTRFMLPGGDEEARVIGARGQAFALQQLGREALACFWFGALLHMVALASSERARAFALRVINRSRTPYSESTVWRSEAEIPAVVKYWQRHDTRRSQPGGGLKAGKMVGPGLRHNS